jgi:hypothetical protein
MDATFFIIVVVAVIFAIDASCAGGVKTPGVGAPTTTVTQVCPVDWYSSASFGGSDRCRARPSCNAARSVRDIGVPSNAA